MATSFFLIFSGLTRNLHLATTQNTSLLCGGGLTVPSHMSALAQWAWWPSQMFILGHDSVYTSPVHTTPQYSTAVGNTSHYWQARQMQSSSDHLRWLRSLPCTPTIHINFSQQFLSSLWSDLSMWGHFLIVLSISETQNWYCLAHWNVAMCTRTHFRTHSVSLVSGEQSYIIWGIKVRHYILSTSPCNLVQLVFILQTFGVCYRTHLEFLLWDFRFHPQSSPQIPSTTPQLCLTQIQWSWSYLHTLLGKNFPWFSISCMLHGIPHTAWWNFQGLWDPADFTTCFVTLSVVVGFIGDFVGWAFVVVVILTAD